MDNHFKKKFIVEMSVALLIVIALFGGILFFKGNMVDYMGRIETARASLASRTASAGELANLRSQYNSKAKNYLNVLYNIIPSYDQLINLNRDIQTLAARSNVEYGFSFAGETPKSDQGLGSISFNLTAGSENFSSLMSFIKSIQDFQYLNSIDKISINSDGGKFTMSVSARVFYR
ncbi:MAG: hypothetical protein AAB399_00405 [Patescibacteria group bacterium]